MSQDEGKTAQLDNLVGTFGPEEELHPDLAAMIEESETFGKCIKHPLVFSIIHHDRLNHITNKQYEQKREALAEALDEESWGTVLMLHERPYRLWAFEQIAHRMDDDDYWDYLGNIWTDSENIWQNEQDWIDALSSMRGCQERMMDDDERKALAALPATLTVYRGFCRDGREAGLSWSLDRDKAAWFASRLAMTERGDHPRLATGTVEKSDVIAHFLGRSEAEIVALPDDVEIQKVEDV